MAKSSAGEQRDSSPSREITEGRVSKGGQNDAPRTPRPPPPSGQAGKQHPGGEPTLSLAELQKMPAPYNPRGAMEPEQLEALRHSLRFFGAVQPVVINRRSGNVVAGHQWVVAAHLEGWERLQIREVDLDEPSEKQLNLALNYSSGRSDAYQGEPAVRLEAATQ